jgi:hypothetical protein
MKKFYHLAAILVILALVAIPLTGCVKVVYETPASQEPSSPSSQQASLSEATICKSVNLTTMAPIERADVFPPDFDIIYCSVKLSNAPSNTQVKVQWFDNNNQQLLEKTITADGTRYIASSITRATAAPFTTGNYSVKLFLNGKEQVTVPFTLQASTVPTVQPAEVSLPNIFNEPKFGYTIRYPADWKYEIQEDGYTVIFTNKKGEETSGIMVIQNLKSTKTGGKYEDADAVMNWMINAIKAVDANAQISDVETVTHPTEDGQQVIGKMCAIAYTYQGQKSGRIVAVIPHSIDGEAFHVWYYEAQKDVFTSDLKPLVEAILESFTLKNTQ